MTTTPFDDPTAYNCRWARIGPQELKALAQADPLLFIADHISISDRREGAVGLALRLRDGQPSLAVIPDAPRQPLDLECLALLDYAIECSPGGVSALGIVHHRTGTAVVSDVDRRWALALAAVCGAFELEPLGVMARLAHGSLVRVPLPEVLPSDYLEGMA